MANINPLLTLFRIAVVGTVVACVASVPFVCQNSEETQVALLGIGCLVLAAIPLFVIKNYDLGEPLSLILLMLMFGVPIKLLYIIATQHDSLHVADKLLDWGKPAVFLWPLKMLIMGWLLFAVGYCIPTTSRWARALYLPNVVSWHQGRLAKVLLIITGFSLICLIIFSIQAGVNLSSLEGLSAKRFVEEGGSGGRIHDPKYFFYRGAALIRMVVYFSLAWMICGRLRFFSVVGLLFCVSLFVSLFMSFMINNRAGIALTLLDCMLITYLMLGGIRLRTIAIASSVAFILFIPMFISRSHSQRTLSEVVEKTMAGRDGLDVTRTSHIINAIPSKLEFRYGEMLYGWMFAPIPRSAWPNKPMWAERGPYILQHVFNVKTTRSGMPPGLPAELYWSFGLPGVWVGLFLMGLLLRHLYLSYRPYQSNPTSTLIYTFVATRFGIFAFSADLGTGIVKTGLDLIPLGIILLVVGVFGRASNLEASESDQLTGDDHNSQPTATSIDTGNNLSAPRTSPKDDNHLQKMGFVCNK